VTDYPCVEFDDFLVCVSVCLHDKTKTAENTIIQFCTGVVHHDASPTDEYQVSRSKVYRNDLIYTFLSRQLRFLGHLYYAQITHSIGLI